MTSHPGSEAPEDAPLAWPVLLQQVELRAAVKATFYLPREKALPRILETYDELVALDDAHQLGPAGANAFYVLAHHLQIFRGDRTAMHDALGRAERWALRHDDVVLQVYLWAVRGSTWTSEVDLGESLRCFSRALDCCARLHILQPQVWVWNALAHRLLEAGLVSDAQRCFARGTDIAGDVRGVFLDDFRLISAVAMARASVELGDGEGALAHLRRYFEIYEQQPTRPNQSWLIAPHRTRAEALMLLGRAPEALADAEQAQKSAALVQLANYQLEADLCMAAALAANGRTAEAFGLLQPTIERMRSDMPYRLATALRTAATLYQRAGQHATAAMYWHELSQWQRKFAGTLFEVLHQRGAELLLAGGIEGREFAHGAHGAEDRVRGSSREELLRLNLLLEEHAVAAERLDDTTGAHCYRVGRMAALLGREVGLDDDTCFMLDLSARLHDVGKLMVPHEILMKPDVLTAGERELMQRHTVAGWELLGQVRGPQVHIAQEIARHHHERWDGHGYPDGLARDAIPVSARVSALADVFDALTHVRPYKHAWSIDDTLEEIDRLRGSHFDPDITDVFVGLVGRLRAQHDDLDVLLAADASRSTFVRAQADLARLLQPASAPAHTMRSA